jgi:xylose isomerase
MLFVLKMAGFKEYFGLDINPERMPVEKAVEINCMALNTMNERINALPAEKIIDSYFDPEKNRGEIEMILVKSMK